MSEQYDLWAIRPMSCRTNGSKDQWTTDQWAVPIQVDPLADRGSPVPDNVVKNTNVVSNTNASGANVYPPIVQMLVNGKRVNALFDKGSTNTTNNAYRKVLNNVLVVSYIPAKYPCDNLNGKGTHI